jgi:prepilin-type N-terminal cleavage/methylation domain-containing protein
MKSKGFTLVEIIVSLAIFSVVAVIAVGALVRVTSANRQAQAIQSGVNNISFVLDTISREMRVGSSYTCYNGPTWGLNNTVNFGTVVKNCTNINSDMLVTFNTPNLDASGNTLQYGYLFYRNRDSNNNLTGTTTVYKGEATSGASGGNLGSVAFYPVTSQGVNIQDFKVGVYNADPYPWVFIRLRGYVGIKIKDQSVFDIQTSVSQRIMNE